MASVVGPLFVLHTRTDASTLMSYHHYTNKNVRVFNVLVKCKKKLLFFASKLIIDLEFIFK